MYIYKELLDDGYYKIKSSCSIPPSNATILNEVSDYADSSLAKFKSSIDEINKSGEMLLKNGRFRVDEILKEKDLTYILIVHNKTTDRYLIDPVRNVLDRLYRMFVGNRGFEVIRHDIDLFGIRDFDIKVKGPYHSDELNKKLLDEFNKVVINDRINNLYKSSTYLKLIDKYKDNNK